MKLVKLTMLVLGIFLSWTSLAPAAEKIYFVQNDHLGTPQTLTDDAQNIVWQSGLDPFGDAAPEVEQIVFNVRFPGQYYDSETGLHYNWNRYYDPETGRYISHDPIGLAGGLNTYGYVLQNPVRYFDPTGLQTTADLYCRQRMAECVAAGLLPVGGLLLPDAGEGVGEFCELAMDAIAMDGILGPILATDGSTSNGGAGTGANSGGSPAVGAPSPGMGPDDEDPKKKNRLPRFNGPKPRYHENPAHIPGRRGYNPRKTTLPRDARDVFKNAVPNDPVKPTAWFGRSPNGQIYRFSLSNDGTAHFSGIHGVGSGVRNLTKYAIQRLGGI